MDKELEKLYSDLLEDIECTKLDIENAYGDESYELAARSRLNVLMQYTNRVQSMLKINEINEYNNIPIIYKGLPIGITKRKTENIIECVLWSNFVAVETKDNKCMSVIILE